MRFFSLASSRPVKWYVLRMWVFSFLPTLLIGAAAHYVMDAASIGQTDRPFASASAGFRSGLYVFGLVVFFSPVVETLILAPVIGLLSLFRLSPHRVALVSALFWAIWHSTSWPPWGLFVFWPFYLMSRIYMAWRPSGIMRACGVVMLVHAAHNLIPGLIFLTVNSLPD